MRMKTIALICLLAGITLIALGLTENQFADINGLFEKMKIVNPIYDQP